MSVVFKGTDFSVPISYVGMYSDGTPMVKTDEWNKIRAAHTMILQANNLQEFMVGMFLADAVYHHGGRTLNLVIPYLPGARQDRVNPDGDVLFTAKSIAMAINQRRFNKVISLDPHSRVMPMFINNLVEFPIEAVARRLDYKKYDGIIAPDKGAVGRAERVAAVMGKPVFLGSKVRDVATGKLTGFEVEALEPWNHYLVVDDICDGGGTFNGLAQKIREYTASADLYVSHGIFSKGLDELKGNYNSIITTNSRRDRFGGGVEVINIIDEMENYNE